jgi:sirohydrochlorin cobaltochelatase
MSSMAQAKMTAIVLATPRPSMENSKEGRGAMHGVPPRDFPPAERAEFFRLHGQIGHRHQGDEASVARYAELEQRLRAWPRTPANDPFHAASLALGAALERGTAMRVVVAFNEFCSPDVDEGLGQAVGLGADEIVVVTPMLTPGGEHAEVDIPAAIERARRAHPGVSFSYAWPIPLDATANFLADHIQRALRQGP